MLLVGQLDSPFTRRVAVSMTTLGFSFERSRLSVFGDVEEMRRLNPLGRVPILVLDDGEMLIDSAAILDHLDEVAGPGRALLPPHGPARRRGLQLIALGLGADEKTAQGVYERMRYRREQISEDWIARCRAQVAGALDALERHKPSPWLLGERMTQADITVATMVGFVRMADPEMLPAGRFPNLEALSQRCEALPAFAQNLPLADERPRGL
jgi:glutathione S-transferase